MAQAFYQLDVVGVYAPLRAVRFATGVALPPGWGADLTACDDLGKQLDFNNNVMREKGNRIG